MNRVIATAEARNDFVRSVAQTNNGQRAISAGWDNALKIWNLDNGTVVTSFYGDEKLSACTVDMDTMTIVAGDILGELYFLQLKEMNTSLNLADRSPSTHEFIFKTEYRNTFSI